MSVLRCLIKLARGSVCGNNSVVVTINKTVVSASEVDKFEVKKL